MNGSDFFVDTNFLIYLLNGNKAVTPYLKNNYFISDITEMEMLGIKNISENVVEIRRALIDNCYLVHFNSEIKQIAIRIKQRIQIKLPDAIVAASAIYIDMPLITAQKSQR
jgi:predicted nucleic acid-binding protein